MIGHLSLDWVWKIISIKRGFALVSLNSSIQQFLQDHYSITQDQINSIVANLGKENKNGTYAVDLSNPAISNAQLIYQDPAHYRLYTRLASAHIHAQEARVRVIKTAQLIDQVEKKVVFSEFANWVGDRVKACHNAKLRQEEVIYTSHCKSLLELFEKVK